MPFLAALSWVRGAQQGAAACRKRLPPTGEIREHRHDASAGDTTEEDKTDARIATTIAVLIQRPRRPSDRWLTSGIFRTHREIILDRGILTCPLRPALAARCEIRRPS